MGSVLTSVLLAMKFGVYLPAIDAPFGGWFYLAGDVPGISQEYSLDNRYPIKVEVGATAEPVRADRIVLGKYAERYVYRPAVLLNLATPLTRELDVVVGTRYRFQEHNWYAQVGLSFKFSSTKRNNAGYRVH